MSAGWKPCGGMTWSSAQIAATGRLGRIILNAQVIGGRAAIAQPGADHGAILAEP